MLYYIFTGAHGIPSGECVHPAGRERMYHSRNRMEMEQLEIDVESNPNMDAWVILDRYSHVEGMQWMKGKGIPFCLYFCEEEVEYCDDYLRFVLSMISEVKQKGLSPKRIGLFPYSFFFCNGGAEYFLYTDKILSFFDPDEKKNVPSISMSVPGKVEKNPFAGIHKAGALNLYITGRVGRQELSFLYQMFVVSGIVAAHMSAVVYNEFFKDSEDARNTLISFVRFARTRYSRWINVQDSTYNGSRVSAKDRRFRVILEDEERQQAKISEDN